MIEQGIVQLVQGTPAVSAIAASGGFFVQLPQDYALPSWTYTIVSRPTEYVLEGPIRLTPMRLQIDCYGRTGADCILLANAIHAALNGYYGTLPDPDSTVVQGCFLLNTLDFFDPSSRTPRRMLDYKIWYIA